MGDSLRKRFVEPGDVETQVFDWGSIKWMSEPRVTEADRFSAGVVTLRPGKGHERHNHPGVEEILYVLSGTGQQLVEDDRREVGPGTMIHIPADVFHETINTGPGDMAILAVYSPHGPEAQLRAMSGCIVLPPGEEL